MAEERAPAARLTTLPNLLGLLRIAATPVVIVLLLQPFAGAGLVAAIVFGLAASTDFVDGRIARSRGQVTPLGVFMDLTADKVLVAGVLIGMVEVDLVPTWMAALLILRELVVQGVRQVAAGAALVMPASSLGKWKTLATLAGIEVVLLAFDAATGGPMASAMDAAATTLYETGYWALIVATALSVASGVEYVRAAMPVLTGRGDRPPAI